MNKAESDRATPPSLNERILRWTRTVPVRRGAETAVDAERFVELFNSTYARKQKPPYYFWRFWSRQIESSVFFVESAGELKGFCGVALMEMAGLPSFMAGFLADIIVERKYRGTGLVFSRLKLEVEQEAARHGAKVVFLLPNARGRAAILVDREYVEVLQIETSIRDTRPKPVLIDKILQIQRVDRFGPWVNDLVEEFQKSHPSLAFVKRTEVYLNWRFVAHPTYTYDILQASRGRELFGYLVLKKFTDEHGVTYGDIVDLLWRQDDPQALSELLWVALAHLYDQGVARAAIWLRTNTILDEVGRDVGFSSTGQPRPVLCKVLDEHYGWLRDPGRWFMTMSDSEIY
jgi:hypothetical protein